jgi:hypothetical protein
MKRFGLPGHYSIELLLLKMHLGTNCLAIYKVKDCFRAKRIGTSAMLLKTNEGYKFSGIDAKLTCSCVLPFVKFQSTL